MPGSEDSLMIGWAISTQYQRVTDRRTDRQTASRIDVQPIPITCAVWLTHVKNLRLFSCKICSLSWSSVKLGTGIVHYDTSPTNGQEVKGQGHRVIKCLTLRRDSRAAPCLCGCVVAQRDGPAWPSRPSSRDDTTTQDCLIRGDRVVGVSYALYRVPSL